MPIKPRTGERVSWRQFFKEWKQGMREVTPLQQCTATQFGQVVTLIGVIWGIIFAIRIGYWWMSIVLIGGLIVLGVQMLANWQRKMVFLDVEKTIKEVNNGNTLMVG